MLRCYGVAPFTTSGATTKELMERMGHTSQAVALLRYQHVTADRQAALASALDDPDRSAAMPRGTQGHAQGMAASVGE
jgi:hypothetical protein